MSGEFWQWMTQKKEIFEGGLEETKLNRVLTTKDLTLLGIGSTLGLGIYVLAGAVAENQAGPAVCISFLVAAVASFFAGLCYAEFGSRVPKAGSAYVYSYVSVGQCMAYVIGWNLILEYVIGAASVAKGYSNYLDQLIGNKMSTTLSTAFPINVPFLAKYPDLFAFGMALLIATILGMGVKMSVKFSGFFTVLNLWVVIYVILCGIYKADISNWQLPPGHGTGGFMPYGISGVMSGAATCFYGFVGFDTIATTGEEAKNPQKSIPLAILFSLTVVFFSYFGISCVLTLMLPYYLQNKRAPLPYAFGEVGMSVAKWIVSVGALFGLSTTLLGAMFPLPRVIYAMSNDGLLFQFMGTVHSKFQTPLYGTIISGIFAGVMAAFFSVDELINMMSIGTLMAYSLVAISVLILRYKQHPGDKQQLYLNNNSSKTLRVGMCSRLLNLTNQETPNSRTESITSWIILIYGVSSISTGAMLVNMENALLQFETWALVTIVVLIAFLVILVIILALQPQSSIKPRFTVPFVPALPCMSVFFNVYLMTKLSIDTWYRFAIWMAVGFVNYICYGWFVNGRKKKIVFRPLPQEADGEEVDYETDSE